MADAAVPGPRSCCGAADTGKQGRRGHREDAAASGARGAGREAGKRQPRGLVRAQGEEGGSRRPSRGFSAQHCASPRGVDADETVAPAGSAGRRAELPGAGAAWPRDSRSLRSPQAAWRGPDLCAGRFVQHRLTLVLAVRGAGCAGHRPAQDLGADSSAPLNYVSKPRPQDVDQLGVANGLVSSEGFAHIPQGRDRLLQGGLAEPESPVESADRAEPPFLIWSPQRAPNSRGVPISNLLCAPPHRDHTPRPGRGCGRLARLAGPPTPLPSRPRHGSDARWARPSPGLSETQQRRPRAAAAPSRDGTGHSPAAPPSSLPETSTLLPCARGLAARVGHGRTR